MMEWLGFSCLLLGVLLWPSSTQNVVPETELRRAGVSLLAVSTGHGNYQVLQRVVTPPIESHLYFVDIDDISIITEDLREAIIELIRVERLRVVQVSSHSAVLQWLPVLGSNTYFYSFLHHSSVLPGGGEGQPNGRASSGGQYHRRTLPGDASWVELRGLQPDTIYTASLTPNSQSNHDYLNTLSVTFTTQPEVLSPAVVTVADSGPDRVRVSWGPLQTEHVQRYQIEYGSLPSGQVHTVRLHGYQNSTLLTGLEPDTQYLVTVSALYSLLLIGSREARCIIGHERTVKTCSSKSSPIDLVKGQYNYPS
uniref:von Willebrand factor A domain-containing protein 1-like isoform X1 n=1 Tax=Oncorhynchus gorbuscha TaxID=8017 RepID=UPI001EAF7ABE|nr:von Willebrand factor A domain-containing protein 1-like isoform X1 [Oncorhynchus gorbuscha]